MLRKMEENFSLMIALGFVVGLVAPGPSGSLNPYILYFLVGIMYFTMLKIDLGDLSRTASRPAYIIYLATIILFLSPVLQYYVTRAFYPAAAASVLIVGSLPCAMSSTSITDLLKGNVHVALLLTVVTSLLAPFTMPFLIKLIIGVETEASFSEMLIMLAKIVFIPFILSIVSKRAFPSAIARTSKYYAVLNIFLLFLIIVGIIGYYADYMLEDIPRTVEMALFFTLLAAMMHVIGWYASFWRPFEDKVASSTVVFYCNISLGVVFTARFFSPLVVLGVVLYNIPWSTMPVPFQYIVMRLGRKSNK